MRRENSGKGKGVRWRKIEMGKQEEGVMQRSEKKNWKRGVKEKNGGWKGKEEERKGRCTCAGDSELCSDVDNGSDFVFSLVEFNHGRIGSDNGRGPAIRTKDFIGETDCGGVGKVVEVDIGRTLS